MLNVLIFNFFLNSFLDGQHLVEIIQPQRKLTINVA